MQGTHYSKAGLDETLVSVSISRISRSKFLVLVSDSHFSKAFFQDRDETETSVKWFSETETRPRREIWIEKCEKSRPRRESRLTLLHTIWFRKLLIPREITKKIVLPMSPTLDWSSYHHHQEEIHPPENPRLVPQLAVTELRANPLYSAFHNWSRLIVLGIAPFR